MSDEKYQVVEIFDSIDGEGITAGCLATFIRLAGCNIRCSYCDTAYALHKCDGKTLTIQQIMDEVKSIGNRHITLTGGEPLFSENVAALIERLTQDGYIVNIETNGTFDISEYLCNPNVIITMDYKTLSSGMNHAMIFQNIDMLREGDVLKIVCEESDFEDIKAVLTKHRPKCTVYLSPIYNKIAPEKLVGFSKRMRNEGINSNIRVQVQLHKIIWDAEKRGV